MREKVLTMVSIFLLSSHSGQVISSAMVTEEQAVKKAKKEISSGVEYTKTFCVFVLSQQLGVDSYYQIHFMDDSGRLKALVRTNAYGHDAKTPVGRVQLYPEGVIFDTTYFLWKNIKELFNREQEVKLHNAVFVLPGDVDDLDILQPCWRVIDENGKDWYVTTEGRIFDAEELRRQAIEEPNFLRETASKSKK